MNTTIRRGCPRCGKKAIHHTGNSKIDDRPIFECGNCKNAWTSGLTGGAWRWVLVDK